MPAGSAKFRFWLLLLGLAAFIFLAHSTYRKLSTAPEIAPAPEVVLGKGSSFPMAGEMSSANGAAFSFAAYSGKVILVNFWASWCAPCLREMPDLYRLHRRLEPRGFSVIAVNMDEDPQGALKVLKKLAGEAPFPVLKGINSPLAERFEVSGLPFSVIVDRAGLVRYAEPGEIAWSKGEAAAMVEGIL